MGPGARKALIGVGAFMLATVSAIAGAVWKDSGLGKTTQPAAAQLAHAIVRDHLSIVLAADPPEIREGEQVRITSIVSGYMLTNPGGILDISCDDNGKLAPVGSTRLTIQGSDSPIVLPMVICRAMHAGTASITAIAKVDMAVDVTKTQVKIVDATVIGQPTTGNLSGLWTLFLGTKKGSMRLIHHGPTVSGDYSTEDGRSGSVLGIADGEAFVVRFVDSKSATGFQVDATMGGRHDSIEISGVAERLFTKDGGWVTKGGERLRFRAVAGGPGLPSTVPPAMQER